MTESTIKKRLDAEDDVHLSRQEFEQLMQIVNDWCLLLSEGIKVEYKEDSKQTDYLAKVSISKLAWDNELSDEDILDEIATVLAADFDRYLITGLGTSKNQLLGIKKATTKERSFVESENLLKDLIHLLGKAGYQTENPYPEENDDSGVVLMMNSLTGAMLSELYNDIYGAPRRTENLFKLKPMSYNDIQDHITESYFLDSFFGISVRYNEWTGHDNGPKIVLGHLNRIRLSISPIVSLKKTDGYMESWLDLNELDEKDRKKYDLLFPLKGEDLAIAKRQYDEGANIWAFRVPSIAIEATMHLASYIPDDAFMVLDNNNSVLEVV